MTSGAEELARLKSRTLWQAVHDAAAFDPNRDFLVGADDAGVVGRLTYSQFIERVRDLSAGLASVGVQRGDRVVLWMTNTLEWVVSAFAIMRLGAAVVPINTFLKPPEVKYFMSQSGARHVVMLDSFRNVSMVNQLTEICPELATAASPGSFYSPELPDLRTIVLWGRSGGKLGCAYDFETLSKTSSPEAHALADGLERDVAPTDLAMVKYTSGSTGYPKGAMLEQGGIIANAILHSRRMGILRSDVYFSMMPFFHAGGSIYGLMTMLANGGTLVFTEAFNPVLGADVSYHEKATIQVGLLAEELVQAAKEKGYTYPWTRVAAVPNEDARKIYPNLGFLYNAMGLTETYAPACMTCESDPPEKHKTNGRPLDGNECRVVDPDTGLDVPPGVKGEGYFRGNIIKGYWNKPEDTARVFGEDGWFRSEDLISMDEDGFVTFHGRLKLMIKSGGENVSLEEVERVVCGHDAVLSCAAVGIPDPRKQEVVRSYVTLKPSQSLGAEDLFAWLKPRLAHFKMPREIIFMETLPRLSNGKLDRVHLKKMIQEEFAAA